MACPVRQMRPASLGSKFSIVLAVFAVGITFEEIAAAKAAGKYLQLIRQLNKSKVLVLDYPTHPLAALARHSDGCASGRNLSLVWRVYGMDRKTRAVASRRRSQSR